MPGGLCPACSGKSLSPGMAPTPQRLPLLVPECRQLGGGTAGPVDRVRGGFRLLRYRLVAFCLDCNRLVIEALAGKRRHCGCRWQSNRTARCLARLRNALRGGYSPSARRTVSSSQAKSHLSAYITQRVARVFAKISQLLEIMIARLDAKISSPENCLCQMSIAGASE